MTLFGAFLLGMLVMLIIVVILYFWIVTHLFPDKGIRAGHAMLIERLASRKG